MLAYYTFGRLLICALFIVTGVALIFASIYLEFHYDKENIIVKDKKNRIEFY